ncbi:MAG: hypothetical protein WCW13_02075 [archaeon]|jgi:hypothetical protein
MSGPKSAVPSLQRINNYARNAALAKDLSRGVPAQDLMTRAGLTPAQLVKIAKGRKVLHLIPGEILAQILGKSTRKPHKGRISAEQIRAEENARIAQRVISSPKPRATYLSAVTKLCKLGRTNYYSTEAVAKTIALEENVSFAIAVSVAHKLFATENEKLAQETITLIQTKHAQELAALTKPLLVGGMVSKEELQIFVQRITEREHVPQVIAQMAVNNILASHIKQ